MKKKNGIIALSLLGTAVLSCSQDPVYVVEDPSIKKERDQLASEKASLTESNETLKKEVDQLKADVTEEDTAVADSVKRLLGLWQLRDGGTEDPKLCFYYDKTTKSYRYTSSLKVNLEETPEGNAGDQATDQFAEGKIEVLWLKEKTIPYSYDRDGIRESEDLDRLMTVFRVENGEKKSETRYLAELDLSPGNKLFELNLPLESDSSFLKKPKADFVNNLFVGNSSVNAGEELFFEPLQLEGQAPQAENAADSSKTELDLKLEKGKALCEPSSWR
ncbi:hypothetical protein [Pseudobacteriovorax antillogorgiicola]|uniref:Lipoprotein n=1 Tax=Pseudobacteriovorax antillogorgiicola TaxID=1513793 RepID=A0A1Y6CER5_9BACT|nr:hypothetical protein [Pseudobacteriovorax antillogorgiicola]TCS48239.1 hypothetical protein EDD56_11819 [Pseudobacteriovorax antillogorgiicola]SMF57294.1 hypothetical protein SAMN06296036_118122 [Pseudobacteriovorax antillogorgiicola]